MCSMMDYSIYKAAEQGLLHSIVPTVCREWRKSSGADIVSVSVMVESLMAQSGVMAEYYP